MFGEKIIKLRKENALTQEELAEKLGVTRQTISKWELGQTVPDKDKLVEMSRVFNVTVDELLNEEREDKKMEDNNNVVRRNDDSRKKIIIGVGIGLGVLLVVWLCYVFLFGKIFSNALNVVENAKNNGTNLVNQATQDANDVLKQAIENGFNTAEEIDRNNEKESFNYKYESIYSGIKNTIIVKDAINEVITNNMKNETKITVKYNDTVAVTSEELASLVANLNNEKYLITYNYNENGYINEMVVADVEDTITEKDSTSETEDTVKKMQEEVKKKQEEVQKQIESMKQKMNVGL